MNRERPAGSAPAKPRVDWVDHAKGICIFFVVMLHVNEVVQEHAGVTGWLENVVVFARPFRMPDFFLIAGLFLASSLKKPWRHYLDAKVIHFFYFYVLWMTVNFLLFDVRVEMFEREGDVTALAVEYLRRFIDPAGPLWFIHMLPIFFVITRLLRNVPWWLVWVVAAALHATHFKSEWNVPEEFAARYVFFYTGYKAAPYIFRIAEWASEHLAATLAYLLAWGVVNGFATSYDVAALPYTSLPLGYAGALAVVFSAVLAAKVPWTAALRYLGANSIVIYLGDVLVSSFVLPVLDRFLPVLGTLALLGTFLTVAGTVGLWQVVIRTPLAFLYQRPAWLRLRPRPEPAVVGVPRVAS